MISFRYHLVSIIAVFLALAVGIVVGTTALNGPVTKDLRTQVNSLKQQRTQLNNQMKTLQSQVDNAGQFTSTFGAQLVDGMLKDTPVLIVSVPGVPTGMQDGIATLLTAAGAKITGELDLAPDYVDEAQASKLNSFLISGIQPIGFTYPEGTSDARILAAALLAFVLTGHGQETDLKTVLGGFSNLHMIGSDATAVAPAQTVVVIGSGTMAKGSYAAQAELNLVNALQRKDATVVVAGDGGSATQSGLVAEIRTSSAKSGVSTIDNADTPYGQVSTVLALAQAIQDSQVGQYGTAPGADALFPRPGG